MSRQEALGGYRAEHGHYPKSLNALPPEFLDHVPQDLFIDKPLHYRLEKGKKGMTAVVYSVGTNQKDDGGTGEGVENHDITVRLGP